MEKRLLWSLWAGGLILWGMYEIIKLSRMPYVSAGCCFGAVVVALSVVRIGRNFPTKIRQEWDLGWGRVLANGIMVFALALAFLNLAVAWSSTPNTKSDLMTFGIGSMSLGLIFGAMLGCGGVLGIREDND